MNDKPFTECSKCGAPQVRDTHSLVLMFRTPEDRDDFRAVIEAEIIPRMTAYPVASRKGVDDPAITQRGADIRAKLLEPKT